MATANEVAEFMLKSMRDYNYYYVPYREVLWAVKQQFGDDWIVENRRGRENLHPQVTAAFRKVNKGEFEWQAPRQRWETVAKR
jgi:hypothetical protein